MWTQTINCHIPGTVTNLLFSENLRTQKDNVGKEQEKREKENFEKLKKMILEMDM